MKTRRNLRRMRCVCLAAAAMVAASPEARAADFFWSNGLGGDFAVGGNWFGGGAPGAADIAHFDLGVATYTVSFTTNPVTRAFHIEEDTVTFSLAGHSYTQGGAAGVDSVVVGEIAGQTAVLTINSGTLITSATTGLTRVGMTAGGGGIVNLGPGGAWSNSAAQLIVGDAGTGIFNQSGGTNTTQTLKLGASAGGQGTYIMNGGTLNGSSSGLNVGSIGSGTFIQNFGTHNRFTASIFPGGNSVGYYALNGGTFNVTSTESIVAFSPGAAAAFYQTGGYHSGGTQLLVSASTSSTALYALSGGTLVMGGTPGFVGAQSVSSATFTQTGGFNSTGSLLVTGSASPLGSYVMSGGTLVVAQTMEIGGTFGSSAGAVSQTGGSASIGSLILAFGSLCTGSYTLSGASAPTLSISGSAYIGGGSTTSGGTGVFNVSSGVATISNTLKIWNTNGTAVNFSGGTLAAGSIDASANPSRFNWTAGSLLITGASGMTIGPGNAFASPFTLSATRALGVTNTLSIATGSSFTHNIGTLSAGTLLVDGSYIYNGGPITAMGNLTTSATGRVFVSANQSMDFAGTVTNAGRFDLDGGAARISGTGAMTNTGLITGDGEVAKNLTNAANGELRAQTGDILLLSGTPGANAGKINLLGGTIEYTQPLTNSTTGLISGRGVLITGGAGLTNNGTFALSAGISDIHGDVTNSGTANIIVSGQANATFWDDVTNGVTAVVKVSPGSSATFFGTYGGAGITGGGNVYFESDITPGFSPAAISIQGNVGIGAQSKLHIELAGHTRGTQYDAIDVSGNLALDGKLAVSTLDGFIPLPGDTFDVLGFGSRSGDLAILNESGFAGLSFAKSYSASALTLTASALPGDANLDGKVNISDLLALATHYQGSANWLGADFNGSGVVDAADLGLLAANWQAGVGAPGAPLGATLSGLGLPQTSAPEPAIWSAILELGLFWSIGLRPRRSRKSLS